MREHAVGHGTRDAETGAEGLDAPLDHGLGGCAIEPRLCLVGEVGQFVPGRDEVDGATAQRGHWVTTIPISLTEKTRVHSRHSHAPWLASFGRRSSPPQYGQK